MPHELHWRRSKTAGTAAGMRRAVVRLVLCTAFALGLPAALPELGAQISPGPLAKAHASLDGPLSCAKCHSGGKEASMTSRCLSCHREIAWLLEQKRGYHARTGAAECASCHPDHAGRDFALVKWPDGSARQFDHARAGFTLDGKHAGVSCEKCHTAELRVSTAASLGPRRTTQAWTGLETSCASCHRDVHQGSLGRACESCHTARGWSPATSFDHAQSRYPLTGKHTDVACAGCHTTEAGEKSKLALAAFKPLPHNDCIACHRDPHAGRLTGRCSSCHVTTSFSSISGRNFSHDRTRYPLIGRHAFVDCVKCHADYPRRIDRPAFATCRSCHFDYHHGQATIAGAAADCASCHSVAGFTPSTFTVAQHARTKYPLEGRHATVSCANCHVGRTDARGNRDVVMHPVAVRCEACHLENAHGSQLAARGSGGACITCHTPAGWKPSSFGITEHSRLRFALSGRHAVADCASCHAATRKGLPAVPTQTLGTARVAFHLEERTCDACHRDPHGGRYQSARPAPEGSCFACHNTRAFHPSVIDARTHAQFSFALEGAHRAAPCVACHASMQTATLGTSLKLSAGPAKPLVYALPGATCASCHRSPHGAQFASRKDAGTCQSCHDVAGWAPASRFVHDANGGFQLGAAHERLPCARCHLPSKTGGERIWRGVPRNCEACHASGARKT